MEASSDSNVLSWTMQIDSCYPMKIAGNDDFLQLEKDFPNFHFHLALDRPDPKADAAGLKYTAGFVAPVMGDTYLKQHENPEDCEYYLCGPPMMAKTVLDLLHSLGVEDNMIRFDNFGG